MQKVHALSHPTAIETHAWCATSRSAGRALGKISVCSRTSSWGPSVSRTVQQVEQPGQRVGADHDVDPGCAFADRPAVLLREAPGHDDPHPRVRLLQRPEMPEVAVEPVVRVLADRAGVEHHDAGVGRLLGRHVAVGREQAGDPLGVVLVHLAPEGAEQVPPLGHDLRLPSRPPHLAYSTERVSRTTVILICPGYCSSSSTCLAMSRAITCAERSSMSSGLTITRTSRPACIA